MPRCRVPSYRKRVLPQGPRAYVTLTDSQTCHRRDCNLGEWGSPASRVAYARLIGKWKANGRRVAGREDVADLTIT
jgi:hypothetical protein